MEIGEVSERCITPCAVNGLDAYNGEINLALDENLISNEFAVKLCLVYEVKKGNKVVKKDVIVSLRGELYFVKFIINPKEYDMEPGVILGRSFTRLVGIDPFEDDSKKTMNDWDQLLDFNFDDIPQLDREELLSFKVLDEIWKDKVELDRMIARKEEKAIIKVKGEALKEKDDPKAFIFPIRFKGKINENALADTGSDINTMPYRIYEKLGREEIKKESDSNDEEEYEIERNKFGAPIVWKKDVIFLGSLPVSLQHVDWKPDYKGCYTNEEEAKGQWRTEIRLTDPYGNIYVHAFTTKKTG
nr:hypothetical protein [Tanacetum cinerariifolium]